MTQREAELLAIGAGPSNLGLAVALEELAPDIAASTVLIDRNPQIEWQSGMLLPRARSQVSFLKDLVTQRNPSSRFSFLNHLHATGRLDEFINMGTFTPYRREMSEYLNWVARELAAVRVELGRECVSLRPCQDGDGTVTGWQASFADGDSVSCRYLVVGVGRDTYIPPVLTALPADRVIHSTQYRQRVAELPGERPYRVAVVGSSQSAAEIVQALPGDLPGSEVVWVMRSIGLSATNTSKFLNELYFPSYTDTFHAARPDARAQILREMHRTNYSCLTPTTLDSLYDEQYLSRLGKGDSPRILSMTDISAASEEAEEVRLELTDRRTGVVSDLHCDLVFLGTGFAPEMPWLIRDLARSLGLAQVEVTRCYRLITGPATAACYLQGVNEATHGIADSLLSVLAHRAEDMTLDILAHRDRTSHHRYQPGEEPGRDEETAQAK
jgi:L-ornithine N5-oxygenase